METIINNEKKLNNNNISSIELKDCDINTNKENVNNKKRKRKGKIDWKEKVRYF